MEKSNRGINFIATEQSAAASLPTENNVTDNVTTLLLAVGLLITNF